jgi:LacI family transcriptional regulator, galactose operon repressor
MAGPPRRTTIVDVGNLAGVSSKSVSRVLNDAPNVTPELRQRVLDAAEALNFHPNTFAQGLVRQRSHLIGLIYENPSPSYVVELQMGVLDTLQGGRYRLVVLPVQSVEQRAREIVGLMRSAGLDGAVLAPPASDHPIVLKQLDAAHMQYARISPTQNVERGLSHMIDDIAAAREIAAHLLALGHRHIGIVQGDPSHPATHARMAGYSQAFAEAGLAPAHMVEHGMFTFESGYEAGKRLLARPDRPTAILAQNDEMAVGAMTAAREAGIDVPVELSVAGFDDSEVARIVWPRLTTVRQPVFEMAAAATAMLLARLEGDPADHLVHHSHTLIVRESTVAPRV